MKKSLTKGKKLLFAIIAVLLTALLVVCCTFFMYLPHFYLNKGEFDVTGIPVSDGKMTVMSYNVRCAAPSDLGKKSWFYRADLIIKNITDNAPDIIGFQEVMARQYKYLTKSLAGYDSVVEYRDNSTFSESCPIFYRTDKFTLQDKGSFWLSETPEVMSKDWDSACYRICSYVILTETATNKEFVIFNTHLDHVSDEARTKGIAVILDKISEFGGLPAVLMGDLNAGESSETYRIATESFLDSKYQTGDTMTSCTYQDWGKALDRPCIDYMMISKSGFAAEKYSVINTTYNGVYPSDHFPVCVNLVLE